MACTKNPLSKVRHFAVPYTCGLRTLTFLLLTLFCLGSINAATQTKTASADDRLIIQPRRIVIVRTPEVAKNFPRRKTAIVVYPVISGLKDPAVLRRVRSLFDFKNIFDYSLQEYREDAWLSEFNYKVNLNSNHLLDITFNQSGLAAYPDDHSKHFIVDLKTGTVIKATDAFDSTKLQQLAELVNGKLQQELKQLEKENSEEDSKDPETKTMRRDAYEALKFEESNLDEFSVNARGVTFLYDAGFPHAAKALEPSGRYFFSYSQLKPFIRPDGPLGQFVR